jgi:hypothetical protein
VKRNTLRSVKVAQENLDLIAAEQQQQQLKNPEQHAAPKL